MASSRIARIIQPSMQAPIRRLLHGSVVNRSSFRCWGTSARASSDRRLPRSRMMMIISPAHDSSWWNDNHHHAQSSSPRAISSNYLSTAAMPRERGGEEEVLASAAEDDDDGAIRPRTTTTTTTTTKAKRKTAVRRDPLIVTPAAASRIAHLIEQHNSSGGRSSSSGGGDDLAVGIRLGTKKRGCNGLSYTLNYAYANHNSEYPRDEVMTITLPPPPPSSSSSSSSQMMEDNDVPSTIPGNGLKVYVEPMALMNVIGTIMDYEDHEMSSEFTFTNPNSKGECGCGESFNV